MFNLEELLEKSKPIPETAQGMYDAAGVATILGATGTAFLTELYLPFGAVAMATYVTVAGALIYQAREEEKNSQR